MEYAAAAGLIRPRVSDVRPQSIVSEALAQAISENPAPAPAVAAAVAVGRTDIAVPAGGMQADDSVGYVPATPDERVASGLVWPPVDGRTVLQELAQARVQLSRSKQGDWTGTANGRWQIHSAAAEVFEDIEAGRMVLVQSARVHAANARVGSTDRCVVLADDGHGRYRLWQIVRVTVAGQTS